MKRGCDTSRVDSTDLVKKGKYIFIYICGAIAVMCLFPVKLVEVGPSNILVNTDRVSKKSPTDLVELAMEIQKADTFIHANACNKLQVIAQQASRYINHCAFAIVAIGAFFAETSSQCFIRSTNQYRFTSRCL